jgi:TolB-like protein/DNA-binding winged helix-turn-helix (wHTH) protein/tetratricopeptide (TPR) repeat protein
LPMGLEDLKRSVLYEIDDLTLDVGQCRLTRAEQPLALTKLNFLVLRCLVESAPNVVSHTELANVVWGARRIITQENLGKRIMLLRQTLGDSAEDPRYIEAVRGLGYRIVAKVRRLEGAATSMDGGAAVAAPPPARPLRFFAKHGAALAAGLGLATVVWLYEGSREPIPMAAAGVTSIAVLPFADRSSQGDQEYFSFGIADEISSKLAEIPELRVMGRSSSMAFAQRGASAAAIGGGLDVTYVVEGSVHTEGDRLQIVATLIDTRSGADVWSGNFEGETREVFAFQDQIAAQLVAELRLALSVAPTPVDRTPEPAVYAAYLQARHINKNLVLASLPHARSLLENAIAEDPHYFPARRELVASYNILRGAGLLDEARSKELLRVAIDDAAALWPERVDIDFWRGWFVLAFEDDLVAAARHFQRALREPANLDALPVLVDFAMALNRSDEAIAIGEYILKRDPVCFFCYHNLMRAYQRAERYDKVRDLYLTARALGFDNPSLTTPYGVALLELNEAEEALRQFDATDWTGVPRHVRLQVFAMTYWALDRRSEFDAALAELQELQPMSAAGVHAFTGNLPAAFAIYDQQAELPPQLFDGRIGDAMRTYERWPELARKAQLWPNDPRDEIPFDISSLR